MSQMIERVAAGRKVISSREVSIQGFKFKVVITNIEGETVGILHKEGCYPCMIPGLESHEDAVSMIETILEHS